MGVQNVICVNMIDAADKNHVFSYFSVSFEMQRYFETKYSRICRIVGLCSRRQLINT